MNRKSRKTTALLSAMAVSAAMLLNIPGSMMVNAADPEEGSTITAPTLNNNGTPDNLTDDYYELASAENLLWFAGLVNGDTNIIGESVEQNTAANAKLTGDIDISSVANWTPIGAPYTGTFDGATHTISGLKINASDSGLFEMNDGTIKNLGVVDTAITGDNAASTGIICKINNGTINNCYSQVTNENEAPGICYNNMKDVNNCYTTAGKVVGRGTYGNSYCLIDSSGNTGGYPRTGAQFRSGEVAYALENKQTNEDASVTPVWGQKIGSDNYPVLGGERVYQHTRLDDSKIYSNSETAPADALIWGYSVDIFNLDEIQLNVKLTVENAKGFKVLVDGNDVPTEPVGTDGNYTVSYPVVVKDIDKEFNVEVKTANDEVLASKSLSVSGYLDALKNDAQYDSKYSALADALLAYGKAANQYFNNQTVDDVKDFNADLSKYKMVLNGDLPEGVEYIGTSLLLNSQTSMRHYFKIADKAIGTKFTVGNDTPKEATKYTGSGSVEDIYYVDVTGISPRDMSKASTVKIGDKNILEYSVLSYAEAVISGSDKNLANLAKALYNYYEAVSTFNPRV